MKSLTRIVLLLITWTGAQLGVHPAVAQENWPTRPVTLIVPFAPGGSTDVTARQLADGLREELGQMVIVENRAGAGGNIGATAVAQASPDGYTLLMATNAHAAATALYEQLQYTLRKDLVPVAQVVSFPNVLVVNSASPIKTLQGFVDHLRQGKEPLTYGSAGNGSSQHLAGALLNNMAQGKMMHIPYKGGAPANAALLAGQIQSVIAPLVEVLPFIKSGQLRALGITTREPSPLLPGVPPIATALPGYEVTLWSGILAPAGTPEPIVRKLNAAVRKVLKQPEMAKKLADQGYRAFDEAPEALGPLYDKEVERWARMVELSGAKIN